MKQYYKVIFLILSILLLRFGLHAENKVNLSFAEQSYTFDGKHLIECTIENDRPLEGFSADIELPKGYEFVYANGKPDIAFYYPDSDDISLSCTVDNPAKTHIDISAIAGNKITPGNKLKILMYVKLVDEFFDFGYIYTKNTTFKFSDSETETIGDAKRAIGGKYNAYVLSPVWTYIDNGESKTVYVNFSSLFEVDSLLETITFPKGITVTPSSIKFREEDTPLHELTVSESYSKEGIQTITLKCKYNPSLGDIPDDYRVFMEMTLSADENAQGGWVNYDIDYSLIDNGDKYSYSTNTLIEIGKNENVTDPNGVERVTFYLDIDKDNKNYDNSNVLNLARGETAKLTPFVFPSDAVNNKVTWEYNEQIISISDDGVITPVAPGRTNIQAEAGGKYSENISLYVYDLARVSYAENRTPQFFKAGNSPKLVFGIYNNGDRLMVNDLSLYDISIEVDGQSVDVDESMLTREVIDSPVFLYEGSSQYELPYVEAFSYELPGAEDVEEYKYKIEIALKGREEKLLSEEGSLKKAKALWAANHLIESTVSSNIKGYWSPRQIALNEYYNDTYKGTDNDGKAITISVFPYDYESVTYGSDDSRRYSDELQSNAYPVQIINRGDRISYSDLITTFNLKGSLTPFKIELKNITSEKAYLAPCSPIKLEYNIVSGIPVNAEDGALRIDAVITQDNIKGVGERFIQRNGYAYPSDNQNIKQFVAKSYLDKFLPGGELGKDPIPAEDMVYHNVARRFTSKSYTPSFSLLNDSVQMANGEIEVLWPEILEDMVSTPVLNDFNLVLILSYRDKIVASEKFNIGEACGDKLTLVDFNEEFKVGETVYAACPELKTFILKEAHGCSNLPEITEYYSINGEEYKLEGIGPRAFADSPELEVAVIPESVEYIMSTFPFENCDNLHSVIMAPQTPPSISSIFCDSTTNILVTNDNEANYNADSNFDMFSKSVIQGSDISAEVSEQNSLSAILEYPYLIKNLKLSGNLHDADFEYLNNQKFYGLQWLDLTLAENIEMPQYAFKGNNRIKKCTLPHGLRSIPVSAFENSCLTDVQFPASLKTIEAYSFKNSKLSDIVIPSQVETIGQSAFQGCNLKSVKIGCSLDEIGPYAFADNSALEAIYCTTQYPPYAEYNTFSSYKIPLYLSDDTAKDIYYYDVQCWGRFKSQLMVKAEEVSICNADIILNQGESCQLAASVKPADATLQDIMWESSNPEVAVVSTTGLVTMIGHPESDDVLSRMAFNDSDEPCDDCDCEIRAYTLYSETPVAICKINPKEESKVNSISSDDRLNTTEEVAYFNLQGIKMKGPKANLPPGIYLVKKANKMSKIIVR